MTKDETKAKIRGLSTDEIEEVIEYAEDELERRENEDEDQDDGSLF